MHEPSGALQYEIPITGTASELSGYPDGTLGQALFWTMWRLGIDKEICDAVLSDIDRLLQDFDKRRLRMASHPYRNGRYLPWLKSEVLRIAIQRCALGHHARDLVLAEIDVLKARSFEAE